MDLQKNLKVIRKKKKLSQRRLAEKSGVSYSMVCKLESGEQKNPSLDTLKKIASALEVKVADIMGISAYLDEVESDIKRTTSFYDYLGFLGYEIGQGEHTDYQMHIKETDTYIELSSDDIELLKELEDSTNKDIKRTIELLIATKSK